MDVVRKIQYKVEHIEKELTNCTEKIELNLKKNKAILDINVRNEKQLRKQIINELKEEKIFSKLDHVLSKLFKELHMHIKKIETDVNRRKETKEKYKELGNQLETIILKEKEQIKTIETKIEEWEERIKNIKKEYLKELKKNKEEKRTIVELHREEINKIDAKLVKEIEHSLLAIERLQRYLEYVQTRIGIIKETQIEIEIPPQYTQNRITIIDTNFFGDVNEMTKGTRIIVDRQNLQGHRVIIPTRVREEAVSGKNRYNRALIAKRSFRKVQDQIHAHLENIHRKITQREEDKLKKAWEMTNRKVKWSKFIKSADAEILIHVWDHPFAPITIVSNDGDFEIWYHQGLLKHAIVIQARRCVRKVV